jgi:hypothetical protein
MNILTSFIFSFANKTKLAGDNCSKKDEAENGAASKVITTTAPGTIG